MQKQMIQITVVVVDEQPKKRFVVLQMLLRFEYRFVSFVVVAVVGASIGFVAVVVPRVVVAFHLALELNISKNDVERRGERDMRWSSTHKHIHSPIHDFNFKSSFLFTSRSTSTSTRHKRHPSTHHLITHHQHSERFWRHSIRSR